MKRQFGISLSALFLLCGAATLSWGWSLVGKDRVHVKNCHSKKIRVRSYDNTDKSFGESTSASQRYIAAGKTAKLKCRTKSCNLRVEGYATAKDNKFEKFHKKRGKLTITKRDKKWKITKGHQSCN